VAKESTVAVYMDMRIYVVVAAAATAAAAMSVIEWCDPRCGISDSVLGIRVWNVERLLNAMCRCIRVSYTAKNKRENAAVTRHQTT
jgi:hypothetical protein